MMDSYQGEPRKELLIQVDGMTCEGCVDAVTRTVKRLDPSAEVEVDLAHGRARIVTLAQAVEVSQALTKAGYEAHAMTG
jgi:copper chaperone